VPLSYGAPHVHVDGRIYRRVGDESDPRPETDRHFLDLLWQRGEKRRSALRDMLTRVPAMSNDRAGASYLEIFIVPEAWQEQRPDVFPEFDQFANLMSDTSRANGGIPLENSFSSSDGYIARQARNNSPETLLLTWRYNYDGVSHITLPFSSFSIGEVGPELYEYTHFADFYSKCHADGFSNAAVIDLNFLFAVFWSVLRRHERLVDLAGPKFPYQIKLRLRGVLRRVPFLDLTNFSSFITSFGIPIGHLDDVFWPPEEDMGELVELQIGEDVEHWTTIKAGKLFFAACNAFGLPSELITRDDDWFKDVSTLSERALNVQEKRNAGSR
jgi:hypothetical protein